MYFFSKVFDLKNIELPFMTLNKDAKFEQNLTL